MGIQQRLLRYERPPQGLMAHSHSEMGVIIQLSLSLPFAPLRRCQNYRAEDDCSLFNRSLAALSESQEFPSSTKDLHDSSASAF